MTLSEGVHPSASRFPCLGVGCQEYSLRHMVVEPLGQGLARAGPRKVPGHWARDRQVSSIDRSRVWGGRTAPTKEDSVVDGEASGKPAGVRNLLEQFEPD